MPPKPPKWFISIPPNASGRGGKQGRDVGRGDGGGSTQVWGRTSLPLVTKQPPIIPQKWKAEGQGDKEQKRPATKAPTKDTAISVTPGGGGIKILRACWRVDWPRLGLSLYYQRFINSLLCRPWSRSCSTLLNYAKMASLSVPRSRYWISSGSDGPGRPSVMTSCSS